MRAFLGLFSLTGFVALVWFLVRVLPKPSRAAYPCQRVAFPLASSFVLWVCALLGSAYAWRKGRGPGLVWWRAALWLGVALTVGAGVVISTPRPGLLAGQAPGHEPLGVAKGIFPGRVVWVHAPDATEWAGYSSAERWWHPAHTDFSVVEVMVSKALRSLSGQETDAAAWESIFGYFNRTHGQGERGYETGEKIAIKINLTTCNARSGSSTVDPATYEKKTSIMNTIDNSPQMILTLLYLVDALYCGYYWDSKPYQWKTAPFGDGVTGDWPSSLFASLDPVAVDSVGYDFLRHEWPHVVTGSRGQLGEGPQDYLHEAAQADNPASGSFYDPGKSGIRLASLGVHEHWNNPADKQYSRNLGTGTGIELIALTATRPDPELAIRRHGGQAVVSWQGSLTNFHLESTARLESPSSWTTVPVTPWLIQGRHTVTNTTRELPAFFRLSQ